MKRLLIGIPAYNEKTTIGDVVSGVVNLPLKGIKKDILVVDDGSTDHTGDIAMIAGAKVARHRINRGLGAALRTIFVYAKRHEYDFLITLDADGQHKPIDIGRIIDPLVKNQADVVVGTRWKYQKNAPLKRRIVNKIANIVTYLFFGIRTSDSQSGFRAFSRRAVSCIRLTADGMEVSSEFFKDIYTHSLGYTEVSIDPIYTTYSQMKGQRLTNIPSVMFELFVRFLRQ